ncbi:hypothetical protein Tco_1214329 [Tanacetum coccineum]
MIMSKLPSPIGVKSMFNGWFKNFRVQPRITELVPIIFPSAGSVVYLVSKAVGIMSLRGLNSADVRLLSARCPTISSHMANSLVVVALHSAWPSVVQLTLIAGRFMVLYEIIPQIASRASDDLIENNLKIIVDDTVIQERDAFQAENNIIQVHPTTSASTFTTTSVDLQQQLYLKMKSNLQDQANHPELWDVLKRKFEKSSTSNTSCRDDAFYTQHHDDHQEDDAPPEGEKRAKRQKTSKSLKSASGSSSKQLASIYVSDCQQQ